MSRRQSREPMSPRELRAKIAFLDPRGPIHEKLEKRIRVGPGYGNAWYFTQQEHWLGWLFQYDGPGAYNRKTHAGRTAEFAYNHINCAPMLVWLAEAAGVPKPRLRRACVAVVRAGRSRPGQCAAFRAVIPWSVVCERLLRGERGR